MEESHESVAPMSGHLFLSYASADRDQALEIADALEAAGTSVWIDRRGIRGGELWAAEIAAAIRTCAALALLCTDASMTSRNIRQEVQIAWDHDRPILPLVPHPVVFPDELAYFLQGRQWIELGNLAQESWVASIVQAVNSPNTASPSGRGSHRSTRIESNLPIPPSEIVGRKAELAEILALLADPQIRLITLVGPGGVGKTRIALEVARQHGERSEDPVLFVNLAPLRDAELVFPAIAAVMGISANDSEHLIQQLRLTISDRQVLLVLDNFEQILDAADQLGEMLERVPGIQALATSRGPLRLWAEHVVEIDPLPVPAPADALKKIADSQNPAVTLFVARATATNNRFELTAENAAAVSEICRRLDGLPLAIELAASRIALFSAERMLEMMDKRLPLLTAEVRDLPERQRTLRNAIAWSEELLTADEQAVFRRLAVFVGGSSLESALAVTDLPGDLNEESEVLLALERLISHSLLRGSPSVGGNTRFLMLETIREFAFDRLEAAGESTEAGERHAAWHLQLAEGTEEGLTGPDHATWFDTLRAEQDNLRAALSWSIDHNPQWALRFAAALVEFWVATSAHQEGLLWCERCLDAGEGSSPDLIAGATLSAARLAYRIGNADLSRTLAERALALYGEISDERGTMRAMSAYGSALLTEDEAALRSRLLNEALEQARSIGDQHYTALIANNLAIREWNAEALHLFEEAIAIARNQGNEIGKTLFLMNESELLVELGRYAEAVPLLIEALESQSRLDHRNATEGLVAVAAVLLGIGGDPVLAVRLHAAAAVEFLQTGSVTLEGEYDPRGASRAELRRKLGHGVYKEAWQNGQNLSLAEALAEARQGLRTWSPPIA